MAEYQTLNVKPTTKKTIIRLAKKHELNLVDFVHAMGVYFDKTGVNPKDMKILSPAEELKKFRDTIISFMRKQEKEFILPTFGKMDLLAGRFMQYLDEEAPRKSDNPKGVLKDKKSNSIKEITEIVEDKKEIVSEAENIDYKEKYQQALNDLERAEMKIENIKTEFVELFTNTKMASTGMSKKLVIQGMSEPAFIDLKKFYNKL